MKDRRPLHLWLARLASMLVVLLLVWQPVAAQDKEISPQREHELFSQIDEMLAVITDITGLDVREPIAREVITREQIREFVEMRLGEETTPEEIRLDELFLKKFGFVDDDFDLAGQTLDVLTEQATALYDYKTKKLYLATWTPRDMQEFALIHELTHAVQDQHFNLEKYVKKARGADEDLARAAVVEGQASWVMIEYVMRQGGRSLTDSRMLAVAAAAASRFEAGDYPIFSSSPLFIQESLLFPYTHGLLFQQTLVEEKGAAGFREAFRQPPLTSQQILLPESYFQQRKATRPRLPKAKLGRGFKKVAEGDVGQLDHFILLKQYIGEDEAEELTPKWRGGQYALFEPKSKEDAVLLYAVEWESPSAAAQYFDFYKQICRKKWKSAVFDTENEKKLEGRSETGGFVVALLGNVVTSVEGLPDDTLNAERSRKASSEKPEKELTEEWVCN